MSAPIFSTHDFNSASRRFLRARGYRVEEFPRALKKELSNQLVARELKLKSF
jgi:hypothetical protein